MLMSYLIDQLHSCFTPLRTLSRSDRGTVTLLRHNQSGQWFVLRDYRGSAEPYRKLLGLSSPHLPQVYEVAEEGGRVLELEEYIPGDTLASVLTGGHTLSPREARRWEGSCARRYTCSTAAASSTGISSQST